MTFKIVPIDATRSSVLRRMASERLTVDVDPGYPCRQCLRDAAVGEEVVLVSFDPFEGRSPYRSASPIFLHAEECSRRLDRATVPSQMLNRQLSVRAFDATETMIAACLIDGSDLADTATELLGHPDVARLHVHNAGPGCFAARVER